MQEGSTLTVRTTGGSVWAGEGTLIEKAAIGTETRGADDLLGMVYGIDAAADRIFILDYAYHTVRVYDMAGDHIMDIGRRGPGPGELRAPTAMGIHPVRGHLIVRESAGGALHRFTLAGEYLRTLPPRLPGAESGTDVLLLRVTRDGVTIVPKFSYRQAPDTDLGYVFTHVLYTIDSTGVVTDSLPLPAYDHEQFILTARVSLRSRVSEASVRPEPVPFGPQEVWSIGCDGALITGYAADYRFEIRYPDGRRTVIEREAEPVPVLREERQSARRRVFGIMRGFNPGWVWNGPEIPDTKPWYTAIIPDRSGRLWVLRPGEGRPVEGWTEPDDWRDWDRYPEWVQDYWFEVFDQATGRYLGRVAVPEGFVSHPEPLIEGDTFICLTEDEAGRPIVRRYRLRLPELPACRSVPDSFGMLNAIADSSSPFSPNSRALLIGSAFPSRRFWTTCRGTHPPLCVTKKELPEAATRARVGDLEQVHGFLNDCRDRGAGPHAAGTIQCDGHVSVHRGRPGDHGHARWDPRGVVRPEARGGRGGLLAFPRQSQLG